MATPIIPSEPGPTITADPFLQPSPTPFQPEQGPDIPIVEAATLILPTDIPPTAVLPSETPTATASPLPTLPIPLPTISIGTRPQYYLNVYLDYANQTVYVGETVLYTNETGISLTNLILAAEPNLWYGKFSLDALNIDDQVVNGYTLIGGKLDIPLATPLVPSAAVVLSLNYRLYLPYAGNANIYGYNSLQINLIDWYPFIVPYDPGQGWLLHEPSIVGEHLVYDVADFEVTLDLADTSLVVAASAPGEWTDQGWHYRFTGRTFVLSISDMYLTSSITAGPVTVTCYYFKGEENAANALLQEIARAVVTYSNVFAPYPYPTLSVVEAATFPDGMEASGIFFLSRRFYQQYNGSVQSNLITIGVHEASHEWWFGMVASDQALEPWLDEALAVYSERIFYELNYPSAVNWWWNFRVHSYSPTGWVDGDIYNAGSFRPYVDAIYLRGAEFLETLRLRIGDDVFYTFLRDYITQMSGGRASADDFFRILGEHTTIDISDITQDYFQVSH